MSTRQKRKSRLSGLLFPAFCALLTTYFVYHAQHGRYGLPEMKRMEEEAFRLQIELTDLKLKRRKLEKRVALLSDGTLEADALDEQLRILSAYASKNDIVILDRN